MQVGSRVKGLTCNHGLSRYSEIKTPDCAPRSMRGRATDGVTGLSPSRCAGGGKYDRTDDSNDAEESCECKERAAERCAKDGRDV
jgi:hypothetical protein